MAIKRRNRGVHSATTPLQLTREWKLQPVGIHDIAANMDDFLGEVSEYMANAQPIILKNTLEDPGPLAKQTGDMLSTDGFTLAPVFALETAPALKLSITPEYRPTSVYDKQQRAVDPLDLPIAYNDYFYGTIKGKGGVATKIKIGDDTYELAKRVDDPESGFAGIVLKNPQTGHAVVMFKGMDRQFNDEGDGILGFFNDFAQVLKASGTGINDQYKPARDLYLSTLNDPSVSGIEVFGYSMGTYLSNLLAAEMGAKVTNAADLGAKPEMIKRIREQSMNTNPELAGYLMINPDMDIKTMNLEGDMTSGVARIGPVLGNQIRMPSGGGHLPEQYAQAAETAKATSINASNINGPSYNRPAPSPAIAPL